MFCGILDVIFDTVDRFKTTVRYLNRWGEYIARCTRPEELNA